MVEQELKPCPNPWCSDSAQTSVIYRGDCYASGYLVHCKSCGFEGPYIAAVVTPSVPVKWADEAQAEAIAAWNTRPTEAAAEARGMEKAAKIVDEVHREMCGQHGIDSEAGGAAFYAAQEIRAALNGGQYE